MTITRKSELYPDKCTKKDIENIISMLESTSIKNGWDANISHGAGDDGIRIPARRVKAFCDMLRSTQTDAQQRINNAIETLKKEKRDQESILNTPMNKHHGEIHTYIKNTLEYAIELLQTDGDVPSIGPRVLGSLVYSSTPWKIYRQDAGMGEYDYAIFLNDVFFARTEYSQTAHEIIEAIKRR
jgi:hypothetical protein